MTHIASLSQLQSPSWALVNGELAPYQDVRIHIGAEALTRALSVFEGVKGYWNETSEVFSLRTPRDHFNRLCRSARLLQIPVRFGYQEFLSGLALLGGRLLVPERDLWFRTTLYVTAGHWGEGTRADLVVTGYTQQKHGPDAMRLTVSSWRRAADTALPSGVKCSANYVGGRLARIEARRRGYDDAVMLNDAGRVAEATGACVLIARKGCVVTPPTTEGCLDSITVAVLRTICRDLGLAFERRPIDRTELLTAEECGLAGTISELTLVEETDGFRYLKSGILARLRERYIEVMRGISTVPSVEMVAVSGRVQSPTAMVR